MEFKYKIEHYFKNIQTFIFEFSRNVKYSIIICDKIIYISGSTPNLIWTSFLPLSYFKSSRMVARMGNRWISAHARFDSLEFDVDPAVL